MMNTYEEWVFSVDWLLMLVEGDHSGFGLHVRYMWTLSL